MISVSFFSEKDNINEVINKIDETSCDFIHVDIADNIFVPNNSLNDELLVNILSKTKHKKDVHLMVKDVKKYVDIYKKINPEFITFHIETNELDMIDYIKSLNIKVGLALDLDSDVKLLDKYLDKIDLVLLMSVKAGFGGQIFNDKVLDKIEYLRKKSNVLIEVDGGINNLNYDKINSDIKVIGSYITKSNDFEETIKNIKKI